MNAQLLDREVREPHPDATVKSSCIDCLYLKSHTLQNRAGYTHFEYAHRQVLKKGFDCAMGHANLHPYSPKTHRIDCGVLSNSCRIPIICQTSRRTVAARCQSCLHGEID